MWKCGSLEVGKLIMKIEKFEDIKAWQEARRLTNLVYHLSKKGTFSRDFALRDQTRKSAISIMANIAEGFQRRSNKEFIQFLYIALGSTSEIQSHLYVALDAEYISRKEFDSAYQSAEEILKMLHGFIKYLKTK